MASLAETPEAAAKFVGCAYSNTHIAIQTSLTMMQCTRRSKPPAVQLRGGLMH
jgi:hypothetical protein